MSPASTAFWATVTIVLLLAALGVCLRVVGTGLWIGLGHLLGLRARRLLPSPLTIFHQKERTMFDASQTLISAVTIVTAAVGNPNFRGGSAEISELLTSTHKQLDEMSRPRDASADLQLPLAYEPAVTVRKSLASPDHIISMIDGKPYKTLRRHLATHGLTPDDYRARYGLKADYPMVAPAYSQQRSQMAKATGLGTKANRTGAEA